MCVRPGAALLVGLLEAWSVLTRCVCHLTPTHSSQFRGGPLKSLIRAVALLCLPERERPTQLSAR